MKRLKAISLLMAMALLISLIPAIPGAAASVIEFNEPAIPAESGKKIDLSDYHVRFTEGGEVISDITWKYNGSEISDFTPSESGVHTLTASSGSDEKNIYVVAKNSGDKDYILYHTEFDSADDISDWTPETAALNDYKVENGNLVIGNKSKDTMRIMLPEWLGEFGNYSIEASVMMSEPNNDSRWTAIMYRIQEDKYPYYQMCVRKNAAASSGVEFAIRNLANGWDVVSAGSHSENQVDGKYYTYEVQVRNNIIKHSIDGKYIIFNDAKKDYQTGRIGVQANFSVMNVDYITIRLQLNDPDVDVDIDPSIVVTTATVENIANSLTNVAYINNAADFDKLENAMSAIITLDGDKAVGVDGSEICALNDISGKLGDNVIPIYKVNDTATADKLVTMLNSNMVKDAAVISRDGDIIKYIRNKRPIIRGIIDLTDEYKDKIITDSDIADIRLKVNGSLAKTAVLDKSALNKAAVEELASQLLTIWISDSSLTGQTAAASLITSGAHGIVSNNPDAVKQAYSLFDNNTVTRTPLIIGHRGNPTQAPENSLSGYSIAIENGACVVETDIYLTKDKQIVIMHDGTVDRTTNGTGNVEALTLEELKKFSLWGDNDQYKTKFPDEKIPTLEELFQLVKEHPDAKIFVEIKSGSTELIPILAALVKEYDMQQRISIISFGADQLKRIQELLPEVSCGYLLGNIGSAVNNKLALQEAFKQLNLIQPYNTTLNVSYPNLSKAFANATNNRGVTIWPWTFRLSSGVMTNVFSESFMNGIGGLTTDDPQYTVNNIKTITADSSMKIAVNGSLAPRVTAVTYGREKSDEICEAVILDGSDIINYNEGLMTGIKEGSATVMFKYKTALPDGQEYVLYTQPVTINVVGEDDMDTISLKSSSSLEIRESTIKNISVGTTVAQLLMEFENTAVKVYGKDDNELEGSAVLYTGCKIKSFKGTDIKDEKNIAVCGDLDGDGQISNADLELMFSKELSFTQQMASDYNKNNEVTTADYISIYRSFNRYR